MIKGGIIGLGNIALPHNMHKEYKKMALNAKKAVLCEKPAALWEVAIDRKLERTAVNTGTKGIMTIR